MVVDERAIVEALVVLVSVFVVGVTSVAEGRV